ncbi:hypothetical protein BA190_13005 [Labrys sp. WJW]|uniref:hypothetical protein n=1 Tax=Labrys sp. WJW TaxID=1737983 RepID=UPI00082B7D5A|nr:hypothetical protein [Labrys sp. WJW]OCC04611.1 hypothetical protein BA190_13005 [Labrys sp. WJW]
MIRNVRPVLCLLLALLFAVTSVGWAMASTRMAGDQAMSHHAGKNADAPDHGGDVALEGMSCHQAPPCGGETHEGEAASTCCALACHVAMETGVSSLNARTFIIAIRRTIVAPGLPMSMLSLLDRPPRQVDATVG